jgi:C4-dicarboxylate-specific signal transduction histidine kinase
VHLVRNIPPDLPMVACPMAQLTEMLMKLLDFALRRLRDSQPPRELKVSVTETGPAVSISLWDSGTPLSIEAEQRLVTPFRFTQSAGGGEIEFALARALAQSSGGTLRLRPRPARSARAGDAVGAIAPQVADPRGGRRRRQPPGDASPARARGARGRGGGERPRSD